MEGFLPLSLPLVSRHPHPLPDAGDTAGVSSIGPPVTPVAFVLWFAAKLTGRAPPPNPNLRFQILSSEIPETSWIGCVIVA